MICSRRKVAECHLTHTVTEAHPLAVVDAVLVFHLLGECKLHCRETQRERVILLSQVEALSIDNRSIHDVVDARLHSLHHFLFSGAHLHKMHSHLLLSLQDVFVAEEGDTVVAAEGKTPLMEARSAVRELVALQSVAHTVVHEGLLLDVHMRESAVGAYPEVSVAINLHRAHGVVWHSVGSGVHLDVLSVIAYAVESVACTHPQRAVRSLMNIIYLQSREHSFLAELADETLLYLIVACQAVAGGKIHFVAVVRERERHHIVGNQRIGFLAVRMEGLHLAAGDVVRLQTVAQRSHPHLAFLVGFHSEDILSKSCERCQTCVCSCCGVQHSSTFKVRA